MKFAVGDIVKIKASDKTAKVVRLLTTKIVEINCEGEVFPIATKDVVKDNDDSVSLENFDQKKNRLYSENTPKASSGTFYLAFEPIFSATNSDIIASIKISFINQTSYPVYLSYDCMLSGKINFSLPKTVVENKAVLPLHEVAFEQMNGQPKFSYVIKPLDENVQWENEHGFYFKSVIKLTPKKLFVHLSKMETDHKTSFQILLAELKPTPQKHSALTAFPKKKKRVLPTKNDKRNLPKARWKKTSEIDLHAEALGIATQRLSHFEILQQQLNALDKALDKAISHGQTSIIIIHGIGNGKLKTEVQKRLREHSHVSFFQDDWRPNYGKGATEAFFK